MVLCQDVMNYTTIITLMFIDNILIFSRMLLKTPESNLKRGERWHISTTLRSLRCGTTAQACHSLSGHAGRPYSAFSGTFGRVGGFASHIRVFGEGVGRAFLQKRPPQKLLPSSCLSATRCALRGLASALTFPDITVYKLND
jgi:hypothetical protein